MGIVYTSIHIYMFGYVWTTLCTSTHTQLLVHNKLIYVIIVLYHKYNLISIDYTYAVNDMKILKTLFYFLVCLYNYFYNKYNILVINKNMN